MAQEGGVDPHLQEKIEQDFECTSMMDELLEILKLLNYEQKFCKTKGYKPFPRTYFCYPSEKSAEQFLYFNNISVWLLGLNGVQVSGWSKFDDPTAVCNNLILELTKLGITFDFPPTKFKSGSGEAVCTLLLRLAQRALKHKKFAFAIPKVVQEESKGENEDDMDAGDEGVDEELDNKDFIDDDIGDAGKVQAEEEEEDDHNIMEAVVSPEEWNKECERVGSRLKMPAGGDTKEWRTHLEQAKRYSEKVKEYLPESRNKLEKTADELTKLLERISGKEKVINKNFAHIVNDYKVHADTLKDVRTKSSQLSENYQRQQERLLEITEKLEDIQGTMNDQGTIKTDTSPLVSIKKAIHSMRQEILNLDIRLGVVGNTLMHHAKMREKPNDIGHSPGAKGSRFS